MPFAIGGPRAGSVPGPGAHIDPTHPLANGLILCCPTPWYDIVRGNPITPSAATIPYGSHNLGMGATVTSSDQFDVADDPVLHALSDFTVAGWGIPASSTAILLTRDASPATDFGLALFLSTSGGTNFSVKTSGGQVTLTGGTVAAGQTYMAAGTFRPGDIIAYLNGTRVGSSALAGTYVDNAADAITLGRSPGFGGGAAATIGPIMLWNRALTPGEIQQLHATPFCMVAHA